MSEPRLSRRRFVTIAAASVLTPEFPLSRRERGSGGEDSEPERGSGGEDWRVEEGVRLGVASYSLRNFPRDRAIAMAKTLGARYINLKSVHLPFELSCRSSCPPPSLQRHGRRSRRPGS